MSDFKQLQPYDEFNKTLESNVHPKEWTNPTPSGRYNLVVVGAGTAGLVTAAGAAGLGAKVALVERELMGGDCLNVGCVPSKSLISSARVMRSAKYAASFGIETPGDVKANFPKVMQRMRELRSGISHHDSTARFRDLGIDVYLGSGQFTGDNTMEVAGQTLEFKKVVIATGARAAAPPIPGLDQVDYLTNETVFSLEELPQRLGIIGAGPIGCELAQTFALLGSEVFLVESAHGIMPREDPEAAAIVEKSLADDGVKLLCCGKELKVEQSGGQIHLVVESHGQQYNEPVDKLLVAAGRAPNVNGMGLEKAGVEFDLKKGVTVNDRLQTTNASIFAAGDVCSKYQFTHAADFMARIVIQNSLFFGRAKASALTIPWSTYTTPEIAHVGLYEHEAKSQGIEIDTYRQDFSGVDRAILAGETEGFVKVHTQKGSDKIMGATIVSSHAGELISQIGLAMKNGLGLKAFASTIYPYPTQAEAIRKLGDQYNRSRLTPLIHSLFQKWCAFIR